MSTAQPGYRILDHTADVGLEARGGDLAELFSNAARGMFAIISSLDTVKPCKEVSIEATADNLENLLVNWLSELLYISATKVMLFCRFDIAQIDREHVVANALGEPIDQNRHELYTEIKAVTYHDLKVDKADQIWVARVLFDV